MSTGFLVRKKDVLGYLSVEQSVKRKNVYGAAPPSTGRRNKSPACGKKGPPVPPDDVPKKESPPPSKTAEAPTDKLKGL
jgi:hypothetical protein